MHIVLTFEKKIKCHKIQIYTLFERDRERETERDARARDAPLLQTRPRPEASPLRGRASQNDRSRCRCTGEIPLSSVWKVWYVEQWIKMGQTRALSELFQTCHSGVAMRSVSEAPLASGVPREVTFEYVALRYDSSGSPFMRLMLSPANTLSRHACAAPEREGGSARLALFGVIYRIDSSL